MPTPNLRIFHISFENGTDLVWSDHSLDYQDVTRYEKAFITASTQALASAAIKLAYPKSKITKIMDCGSA